MAGRSGRLHFSDSVKQQNGSWDGRRWLPASAQVADRAPPKAIPASKLADEIWFRALQAERASPYDQLWTRDEAYLEDPALFRVRHAVDSSAEPDLANVQVPSQPGWPGKPALRKRPLLQTQASREYDDILGALRRLNVKVRT